MNECILRVGALRAIQVAANIGLRQPILVQKEIERAFAVVEDDGCRLRVEIAAPVRRRRRLACEMTVARHRDGKRVDDGLPLRARPRIAGFDRLEYRLRLFEPHLVGIDTDGEHTERAVEQADFKLLDLTTRDVFETGRHFLSVRRVGVGVCRANHRQCRSEGSRNRLHGGRMLSVTQASPTECAMD
ncbi:hypothetical protein [Burkholderia diffusa]|nr:hypothetical protein [Burkholderia diffusa]